MMKSPATVSNSSREKIFPESVTPRAKIDPAISPAKASRVARTMIATTIAKAGGSAWPSVSAKARTPRAIAGTMVRSEKEPKIALR